MANLAMPNLPRRIVTENGEIDLLAAVGVLWWSRWLIITCIAATTALAILYSLTAARWYRAEVSIVQVGSSGIGGALDRLGALGSIVGIGSDLSGSEERIPLAVLQSRALVNDFVSAQKLTPELFHGVNTSLRGMLRPVKRSKWTERMAVDFFDGAVRSVDTDRKSGVVKLAINWIDPGVAARWANQFIVQANETLRAYVMAEAERNIAYLNGELRQATMPSVQQSLGRVLEAEIRKKLLAQGDSEFAFRVVDRAEPPRRHYRPSLVLPLALAILVGAAFGAALALLRYRRASSKVRQ